MTWLFSGEAKRKTKKKIAIIMPYILRLDRVINLLEVVEPSKIVVMRDEHSKEFKKFLARVCSRQETFFKGLKDWKILRCCFAYGSTTKGRKKLHKMAIEAIAVIRQYDSKNDHPPFEVC
jgi:hypothetical protein